MTVGVACGGIKVKVGIDGGCGKAGAMMDNGASEGQAIRCNDGCDTTPPSPPLVGGTSRKGAPVGTTVTVGASKGAGPCGVSGTAGCGVEIDRMGAVVGIICGTSGQPDRVQHCFGQWPAG